MVFFQIEPESIYNPFLLDIILNITELFEKIKRLIKKKLRY